MVKQAFGQPQRAQRDHCAPQQPGEAKAHPRPRYDDGCQQEDRHPVGIANQENDIRRAQFPYLAGRYIAGHGQELPGPDRRGEENPDSVVRPRQAATMERDVRGDEREQRGREGKAPIGHVKGRQDQADGGD